ncbi:MAG: hypothetical protein GC185_13535 [Alphaproteobacteria bacterium]|nr:hypothetical protein [Alphaproteobacteria bacterium]
MVSSKFINNDTDAAKFYVADMRHALSSLPTAEAGMPTGAGEGQALRGFFDKMDTAKMQKGLAAFGLSLPGGEKRLAEIQNITRNVPRDHGKFVKFMQENGFHCDDDGGGGSHRKYRNRQDPRQYVTYSAHMKLGTTGQKVASGMQTFMLANYARELRETLSQLPPRLARGMRKEAAQERKKLTR